jgi:hypothetical protein
VEVDVILSETLREPGRDLIAKRSEFARLTVQIRDRECLNGQMPPR